METWRRRRFGLLVIALLFAAPLTACGGSSATDTPKAPAPTIAAPAAEPTTTAASAVAAGTRPAGSVATGASVVATTVPTAVASSVPAPAATRPAATGSTAANPASAIAGTRPAGSTAAAGSATAGAALTLFTDPKGRFSFSRPAVWTVGQPASADSVAQFSSTNPLGVVDISTESVAGGITPDTYRDAAFAEITKGIPDARQIGTTRLQLDTEPAIQIDYTGTVGGKTIYFSQIFALHTGTAYVLTLGTQPADSDAMKQQALTVLRTWKFLQ